MSSGVVFSLLIFSLKVLIFSEKSKQITTDIARHPVAIVSTTVDIESDAVSENIQTVFQTATQ